MLQLGYRRTVNDAGELSEKERRFLEHHEKIMEGVRLDKNESWGEYIE